MKTYIIYLATSPSNKVYVGTTSKSLIERSKEHIWLAKGKKQRIFQSALRKYNYNFKWEVLEENLNLKEAELAEKYYIAFFNSTDRNFGYNLSPGGFSGNIRSKEGEEIWKQKMQEHWDDLKFQKKLSEGQKKRFENENPWNKGKQASKKTKEKLRISHVGKQSRLGHKIQFCPKGHDTFICGREKSGGGCKQCRRKAPMI
jgi:group I intron endonuclease